MVLGWSWDLPVPADSRVTEGFGVPQMEEKFPFVDHQVGHQVFMDVPDLHWELLKPMVVAPLPEASRSLRHGGGSHSGSVPVLDFEL